eukprot:GHVP01032758.1.p1 GENE.GHVP01032758.1~~GHVP01032758.1.p1  ORF type:complete len:507 (+),score=65.36 GHVP01032758.1:1564-3084(+)
MASSILIMNTMPTKQCFDREMDDLCENLSQFGLQNDLLQKCFHALMSNETFEVHYEAARKLRKLLQKDESFVEVAVDVLDAGLVPRLIWLFNNPPPEIGDYNTCMFLKEIAWCLTNISAGNSKQTAAVVEHGGIIAMLNLLNSTEEELQELGMWCLANIAGDCPKFRDILTKVPGLADQISSIYHLAKYHATRRVSIWLSSNICRVIGEAELSEIVPHLEFLTCILCTYPSSEFAGYCIGAFLAVLRLESSMNDYCLTVNASICESLIHYRHSTSEKLRSMANEALLLLCNGPAFRVRHVLLRNRRLLVILKNDLHSYETNETMKMEILGILTAMMREAHVEGAWRTSQSPSMVEFLNIFLYTSLLNHEDFNTKFQATKLAVEILANCDMDAFRLIFQEHDMGLVSDIVTYCKMLINHPKSEDVVVTFMAALINLVEFGDELASHCSLPQNPVKQIARQTIRSTLQKEMVNVLDTVLSSTARSTLSFFFLEKSSKLLMELLGQYTR